MSAHQAKRQVDLLTTISLVTAVAGLLIAGFFAIQAVREARDTLNEALHLAGLGSNGPGASRRDPLGQGQGLNRPLPEARAPQYRWTSARPFLVDLDGDGVEDIVGLTQARSSQWVELTAISGADQTTIWQIQIGAQGNNRDLRALRYEPTSGLILVPQGTSLTAYEVQTGAQRWTSALTHAIDSLALTGETGETGGTGETLWAASAKQGSSELSLADGTITARDTPAPKRARLLPDDERYQLIPDLRTLDLKTKQFAKLLVRKGYCPKQALPVVAGRQDFSRYIACAHPHGLAFATASSAAGPALPFLVGYERATKAERWRTQLASDEALAGAAETVGSGFDQTRADLFGDEAVVSFVPSDANPRVRRLSLIDGSTKWEHTLSHRPLESVEGIVIGEDHVLVNYGARLHVLDRAEGRERAVLGGW